MMVVLIDAKAGSRSVHIAGQKQANSKARPCTSKVRSSKSRQQRCRYCPRADSGWYPPCTSSKSEEPCRGQYSAWLTWMHARHTCGISALETEASLHWGRVSLHDFHL